MRRVAFWKVDHRGRVRPSIERVRPAARAMEDGEDFYLLASHPIGRDVRRAGYDKLASPCESARPAEMRMVAQLVD